MTDRTTRTFELILCERIGVIRAAKKRMQQAARHMKGSRGRISVLVMCLAIVAAGFGTTTAATAGASSKSTTSASQRMGLPHLKGATINLGKAANEPLVEDAVSYIVVQLLKQWGAHASLTIGTQTLPGAVLAGKLQATGSLLPAAVNSGLIVFGPSQARLDYVVVARPSIHSVKGLIGKPFALTNTDSADYTLLGVWLSEKHLAFKSVVPVITGNYNAVVSQFVTGRSAAAFVHITDLSTLKSDHVPYRILATSAQIAPWAMDSVEMATHSWIFSHSKLAKAVDLAWLYAAHLVNTNRTAFVKYAKAYTNGAVSTATILSNLKFIRAAGLFPTSERVMSKQNLLLYLGKQAIFSPVPLKASTSTPFNQWGDLAPWYAAWAQYVKYPNAVR